MAGTLALTIRNEQPHPVTATATRDQWHQIHYSRYFAFPNPSLSSTYPSLVPLQIRRKRGTWISTSSPDASLHIIYGSSTSDTILSVYFGEKILIQKFALRFSTNYEAESFVNVLLETLKNKDEPEPLYSDFQSEISSRSEFMSSSILPSRACEEELGIMTSVDTYTPEMPPSLNNEVDQPSCNQETNVNHVYEGLYPTLPPSFTSLITNCCSGVKEGWFPVPVIDKNISCDPIGGIWKIHLSKVEKVIDELGAAKDLSVKAASYPNI
ncbi:hypothetical protein CUMW_020990 [Citrus unshiu]|nr:hypothetical protein CUMW_020990 [Citrus unshiu]